MAALLPHLRRLVRQGPSDAPGPVVDLLGRVGLVGYGVVHLLVAWLAVQIALGTPAGNADVQGAVASVASTRFGSAALVVAVVCLVAFALWQVTAAVLGFRWVSGGERVRKRVGAVSKAIAMLGLAAAAATFLAGGRSSGDAGAQAATADLLLLPAGRFLVAGAAVAVLVVAVAMVYTGVRRTFMGDLDVRHLPDGVRHGIETVGVIGHVARALAFGVVGVLLGTAALASDATRAGGLDAALRLLGATPLGASVLVVVGLGFGAFGLFCIADALTRRA
ncbi:MAG: DUF1206 domain-containing protein [Pseudonocardia sp.]|nr:DUF1206 domain-containing protein [Pseudonocardia sp.]